MRSTPSAIVSSLESWMNLGKNIFWKSRAAIYPRNGCLFECKWCRNLGFGINIGSLSALRCRNQQCCRTGGAGGGAMAPHILTDELALSQPWGEGDYAHHITTCRLYFHTFLRPWPGPSPHHLLPIGYYYYYSTSKVSIDLIQRLSSLLCCIWKENCHKSPQSLLIRFFRKPRTSLDCVLYRIRKSK